MVDVRQVQKALICLEDMQLGKGSVAQTRGQQALTLTKANLLFTMTMAEAIASEVLVNGTQVIISDRGYSRWDVVLKASVVVSTGAPTFGNIVEHAPGGLPNDLALSLYFNGNANLIEFGGIPDSNGVAGNGTDSSLAWAAAALAIGKSGMITIPHSLVGAFRIVTGVTINNQFDGIIIEGGGTLFYDATAPLLTFGSLQETPDCKRLLIRNIKVIADATDTSLGRFFAIRSVDFFAIVDCHFVSTGNGGIACEWGAQNGNIARCKFTGVHGNSTRRCIWVLGDAATGFASQLMDTSTLQRNATPLPTNLTPWRINVTDCDIRDAQYGVYTINARRVKVIDTDIEADLRCIAFNNYSPDCGVKGGTLRDSTGTSGTGILVTQFSSNVVIEGVHLKGTFAGNRAIYVQFGADAFIHHNVFSDIGSQNIAINMNGTATIENNQFFTAPDAAASAGAVRAIRHGCIDSAFPTFGATATEVNGIKVRSNTFGAVDVGILFDNFLGDSGANSINVAQCDIFYNTIMNRDDYPAAGTSMVVVDFAAATSILQLGRKGNTFSGESNGVNSDDKYIVVTGSGDAQDNISDTYTGFWRVDVNAGAITFVKLSGDRLTLSASISSDDVILTPRQNGSGIAVVSSIVMASSTIDHVEIADWSDINLTATFKTAGGATRSAATEVFSFYVHMIAPGTSDV